MLNSDFFACTMRNIDGKKTNKYLAMIYQEMQFKKHIFMMHFKSYFKYQMRIEYKYFTVIGFKRV